MGVRMRMHPTLTRGVWESFTEDEIFDISPLSVEGALHRGNCTCKNSGRKEHAAFCELQVFSLMWKGERERESVCVFGGWGRWECGGIWGES